ncbi:MAG: SDR family NAD(P)-dependent oxidoreductase [Bryobacteraceae bacterium]|nr:SDR family NAD(P)-dependent oxidoreductase [Bryobacteraceae bacterium]
MTISLSLAASGYHVLAIYARNRQAADRLPTEPEARGLSIQCVRADIADEDGLQQALKTIRQTTDRIDVVVHSAASGVHRETAALTEKHITWTFKVNVFSIQNLADRIDSDDGSGWTNCRNHFDWRYSFAAPIWRRWIQ